MHAAYVARTAAQPLPDLRRHLRASRTATSDIGRHIAWYLTVMVGGTPAQWFDVIVHRRELTPA